MAITSLIPTAVMLTPHSLEDIKTGVWEIQDSKILLFKITELDAPTYIRALDYLRGYVDCCHARMAMTSSELLLIAPNNVDISGFDVDEVYHAWETHY